MFTLPAHALGRLGGGGGGGVWAGGLGIALVVGAMATGMCAWGGVLEGRHGHGRRKDNSSALCGLGSRRSPLQAGRSVLGTAVQETSPPPPKHTHTQSKAKGKNRAPALGPWDVLQAIGGQRKLAHLLRLGQLVGRHRSAESFRGGLFWGGLFWGRGGGACGWVEGVGGYGLQRSQVGGRTPPAPARGTRASAHRRDKPPLSFPLPPSAKRKNKT